MEQTRRRERLERRGAACAVLFLTLAFPASAKAAFPGANGKIAHTRVDELWTTNGDGTAQTLLASPPHPPGVFYSYGNPAWSPDGAKLAFQEDYFASGVQGADVIVANADGTGKTNITNGAQLSQFNTDPSWSPDGTKIAFVFGRSPPRIYVMSSDGSGRAPLTTGPDTQPALSPDGSKVAFTSTRDTPGCTDSCNYEIYVANVDGSAPARLTVNAQPDTHPAWSPDGAKIAFARRSFNTATQRFERNVWVMNADGSAQAKLTSVEDSQAPAWSPGATKIAFDTSARSRRAASG